MEDQYEIAHGLLIGTPFRWTTVTSYLTYVAFSGARCVEAHEDRPILSAAKRYSRDVAFSDVQTVHKFAEWVTPKIDFKVTIFFNFKYLENDTSQSYTYITMADW